MNEQSRHGQDDDCSDLLNCLDQEQRALEQLLFKLREQHLILTAGEQRWLSACTSEVEDAVKELTRAGHVREGAAGKVHAAHQLPNGSTLSDLADRVADELAGQHLRQRQMALRNVLDQVRRCSRQNRQLLASGLAATNDALALLGAKPTYDASGAFHQDGLGALRSYDFKA